MKRVLDFLKNIVQKDEICIIYHNDIDGCCSCALLLKYFEHIGKKPYIISQPMPTDKNLLRRIQTGAPNKIIFLDLAVDQQENLLKRIRGFADILIVDHHHITKDVNSKNIVHYNPRFENPRIYQSVSYLIYKILSKLFDVSGLLWIASIGIIGDYDISDSLDLIKQAEKKYDIKLFNKIAAMMESVRAARSMSPEQIVELILNVKNPEQILETGDFIQSYQKITLEIDSIMLDAENAERIGNIIFYNIMSKYNVRSQIATKLSEKYPDKLIIVYERIGKKINVAARSQRFDVNKILRRACIGIKASAGGHEAAGGATLDVKFWEKFKNNLIDLMKTV